MKPGARKQYVLLLIFAGLILSVIAVFLANDAVSPDSAETGSSAADLTISRFRHTATENGRTSWTLEADSAQYFRQKDAVRLVDVNTVFFTETGQRVQATATHGEADIATRDMRLSGNTIVTYPGYRLETEVLTFSQSQQRLNAPEKTTVTSEFMIVQSDGAAYDLTTRELFLTGNIQGEIHGLPDP